MALDLKQSMDLLQRESETTMANIGLTSTVMTDIVLQDFVALHTILEAAGHDKHPSPTAVSQAHKHLTTKECEVFYKEILAMEGGKAMIESIDRHLMRHAADSVADSRMTIGAKFISDPAMPAVKTVKRDADADLMYVTNAEQTTLGKATEVMRESLQCVAEAVQQWSNVRLEESHQTILNWLGHMKKVGVAIDMAQGIRLLKVVMQPELHKKVQPELHLKAFLTDDPNGWHAELSQALQNVRAPLAAGMRSLGSMQHTSVTNELSALFKMITEGMPALTQTLSKDALHVEPN